MSTKRPRSHPETASDRATPAPAAGAGSHRTPVPRAVEGAEAAQDEVPVALHIPGVRTPMVRGPYSKTAARRREILDAAVSVFGRSGYRSGSLREIAEAVGMSQAGLLHHFGNKSNLLIAVLQHRDYLALDFYRGWPRGIHTLLATVDVLKFNAAHRGVTELYCLLSAEATNPEHPAHEYFVARYHDMRELLDEAFANMAAAQQLRKGVDLEDAASSTIAILDGLQQQWLLDPTEVDALAGFRRHVARFVLDKAWAHGEQERSAKTPTHVDRVRDSR